MKAKVLIIGLGSIGIRHAKALIDIIDVEIAALRTNKGNKELDNFLNERIQYFYSEQEAVNWNPTHVIVSNPTSLHIKYLKIFKDKDVKIFIEKPIADNLIDIEGIEPNLENVFVGYNLRFHQLIQVAKNAIESNKYGKVLAAELSVGHYLPSWHTYEDYRTGYAAQKKLGGGVLRTLSHEIDLTQFFFGKVKSVFAKVEKISQLEIDVDDYTLIIADTELCSRVLINLNYLNPTVSRTGKVFLEKGVLEYCFTENVVIFTDYETATKKELTVNATDFNQQYIEQMKDFISSKTKMTCTYYEGLNVMKVIAACEMSTKEKKEIQLL